jgi:hypothetical protein
MIDSAGNPPPSFVAKPFPYKTLPGIPNAQSPPERDPDTKPCDCSVTVSRRGHPTHSAGGVEDPLLVTITFVY